MTHGKKHASPKDPDAEDSLGTLELLIFILPLMVLLIEAIPDMMAAILPAASRLLSVVTAILKLILLPVGVALVWAGLLVFHNIKRADKIVEALTGTHAGEAVLFPTAVCLMGLGAYFLVTSLIYLVRLMFAAFNAWKGQPSTTDEPRATTDEPGATTDEPSATTDEPRATTDEPGATTSFHTPPG